MKNNGQFDEQLKGEELSEKLLSLAEEFGWELIESEIKFLKMDKRFKDL